MTTEEILNEIGILNVLYNQLCSVQNSVEMSKTEKERKIHYEAYIEAEQRYIDKLELVKSNIKKISNE